MILFNVEILIKLQFWDFPDQMEIRAVANGEFWIILKDGNQQSSANVAPVITQGAGPLTKTVAEDGLANWTPAELNATDADTASVGRLLGV